MEKVFHGLANSEEKKKGAEVALEEGSSLNKACRVGGLLLPLLSPILSLSKDQPLLLGRGCLACLLPPSTGLAAFSRSGP